MLDDQINVIRGEKEHFVERNNSAKFVFVFFDWLEGIARVRVALGRTTRRGDVTVVSSVYFSFDECMVLRDTA